MISSPPICTANARVEHDARFLTDTFIVDLRCNHEFGRERFFGGFVGYEF